MPEEKLQAVKDLLAEFSDLSLNDFRDAFQNLVKDKTPALDRYLVTVLKNWSGNRTMRAEVASALSEREDENYIEDFGEVIEKETDVGLCKECINGLMRIGTQEAIQKVEFLAANKPNATIASLLKRELDRMRQEEKEPVDYYLDHLKDGNKNARQCRHSAKVLVKLGQPKVVDTIFDQFDEYDDLARTESSRIIAQLGTKKHLPKVLEVLERYYKNYRANIRFLDHVEGFDNQPKDQRIELLFKELDDICSEEHKPLLTSFRQAFEEKRLEDIKVLKDDLMEIGKPIGIDYCTESLILIMQNQLAHAGKFHEEKLRNGRVRHSRLRFLVAELGYGLGKIAGTSVSTELREQISDWLSRLVVSEDGDIAKMALYGAAYFLLPEDVDVLDATLRSHQLEGMTRLLNTLERRGGDDFAEFFLKVAIKHEILDIQEMAMRALGSAKKIYPKIREMMASDTAETKKTAIRIIGEIKARDFKDDLLALLEGQSDIIRIEAITSLGKFGDADVLTVIDDVMVDAKSPMLIETSLKAIATVGGEKAVDLLRRYAENSRRKSTSITAVRLLVDSYKTWGKPLPDNCSDLILTKLNEWFADRDKEVRKDCYLIAAGIISWDVEVYNRLKQMFKEASTRLRKEASWDKDEMALVEQSVRNLNRTFFFLKDMLEFHQELLNRCRGYDNPSSTARVKTFEKIISHLENNQRFILSRECTELLEKVVRTGLELGEAVWREQMMCYQIAGLSESKTLGRELAGHVKSVPKQAKTALLDALTRLGKSLSDIQEMTAIRNVLVVEGSGFFRKRLANQLEQAGYNVRHTDDLEIAEAMVKNEKPDLVISEIAFKGTHDGADFAEKLHNEYGSAVALLFSTNTRDASILERVAKLGPKGILFKPYPFPKLEEAIKA